MHGDYHALKIYWQFCSLSGKKEISELVKSKLFSWLINTTINYNLTYKHTSWIPGKEALLQLRLLQGLWFQKYAMVAKEFQINLSLHNPHLNAQIVIIVSKSRFELPF